MSASVFLDDKTAPTLPAIPKQDWMGLGELGGRQGGGQRPAPIVLRRALEQAAVSDPSGSDSFLQTTMPPPQIVHQDFFFPSRPPITCLLRPVFLPGKQFGVTWSQTAALLSRAWKSPACSSHLHVQPGLHFHGQGLRGALHHLCASGSL